MKFTATVAALAAVTLPAALAAPSHSVHARSILGVQISVVNQSPSATVPASSYNKQTTLAPGQRDEFYSPPTKWSDTKSNVEVSIGNYPTEDMPNGDPSVTCKVFCENFTHAGYPRCSIKCTSQHGDTQYKYAWMDLYGFAAGECQYLQHGSNYYKLGHLCREGDEHDNKHWTFYVYGPQSSGSDATAPALNVSGAPATADGAAAPMALLGDMQQQPAATDSNAEAAQAPSLL